MRICTMSLLMLGLFDNLLGSSSIIPTKQEQANLLLNVQEVFEEVKVLVNVEGNSTDESVVCDINRMVQRAADKLALLQELALSRLSRDFNTVSSLDTREAIQNLVHTSTEDLNLCLETGADSIKCNSRQLTDDIESATEHAQDFINTLYDCRLKPGLQVVSCYKNIVAKDVVPVKKVILKAMEVHKIAHLRTIEIRNEAGDCVDSVLEKCQERMAGIVNEGLRC